MGSGTIVITNYKTPSSPSCHHSPPSFGTFPAFCSPFPATATVDSIIIASLAVPSWILFLENSITDRSVSKNSGDKAGKQVVASLEVRAVGFLLSEQALRSAYDTGHENVSTGITSCYSPRELEMSDSNEERGKNLGDCRIWELMGEGPSKNHSWSMPVFIGICIVDTRSPSSKPAY